METKLKNAFSSLKGSDKKLKILACIALAGIGLIMLSEFIPQDSKQEESAGVSGLSYEEYTASLEKKTESLLKNINGVGRCAVMITLDESDENVFAKNTNENQSGGSYSRDDEYVLYEGQSGETPALLKKYYPKVKGVAVVCDGADDTAVRESVINSISSLYGVSVSKISVSKYKG